MHVYTRPLISRDSPAHERTSALLLLHTSDLRTILAWSPIKAITVLKRDKTEIEIRPPKVACHGVALKGVHHYTW